MSGATGWNHPAVGGRPIRILLVEDSPSDAVMTMESLREGRIANEVELVRDGELAIAFVRRAPPFVDAERPDLILLDLNLPKKDGREVLAEVKSDPDLHSIPVVVLTTSSAERDIVQSYELQANAYVTKPVGYDAFLEALRGIEHFWMCVVRLPDAE